MAAQKAKSPYAKTPAVYGDVTFRPRHAVAFDHCNLRTSVLGFDLALPFLLALRRLQPPHAPCRRSRRSARRGQRRNPPTFSRSPAFSLKRKKPPPPGGSFIKALSTWVAAEHAGASIDRARTAGTAALVVCIDTTVSGLREARFPQRHERRLVSGSSRSGILPSCKSSSRPSPGLVSFLSDGRIRPLPQRRHPRQGFMPLTDVAVALAESAVTWADLAWIREHWRGQVVVKAVLTGARRAPRNAIKAQPPSPSPITAAVSSIALKIFLRTQLPENCRGCRRPNRNSTWTGGHSPQRRRCRQGPRARSAAPCTSRAATATKPSRRRRSRRQSRHRNPPHRSRPHPAPPRLRVSRRSGPLLRKHPKILVRRLAAGAV